MLGLDGFSCISDATCANDSAAAANFALNAVCYKCANIDIIMISTALV